MASPRERDHRAPTLPFDKQPFDPRVTTRPSDVRPTPSFDPRVTTRPSDVQPRWRSGHRVPGPLPQRPHFRRHHFHDFPPGPHQRYHDYIFVDRGGWWPRWYPYWNPSWYAYWWQLYDYYGGDAHPEYAEYARDATLRQYAPQWGLSVGGEVSNYASHAMVGIQPYGVPSVATRHASRGPEGADQLAAYRALAVDQARRVQAAVNRVLIGYRDSPWGSEITVFGARAGLQRWAHEQAADADVWYAAAFDLSASTMPLAEVAR